MNLNQLYFDHQVMLIKAAGAGRGMSRQRHETCARAIAGKIASVQENKGARAAVSWLAQSAPPGAALSAAMTARGFVS